MNHQWIDTDGDCSCLNCDINWTPERVDGSCVDVAVNDAFDAMINEAPDYQIKRERLHRIFAMADAAIESAPVGERISFETAIVANQIADNEDAFRSPDELIADALSRYSVLDLRELTDDDLDRADELTKAVEKDTHVIEKGETNLIRWWKIRSGDKDYEVRRFENFCFCSCLDFFYRKTACRHIYITTKDYAFKTRREMQAAPYLKQPEKTSGELVGKIRI